MTLVLDTGGIDVLATDRARLAELRRRGQWPPVVPTVVLTEALTGDHRRDFHTNRMIKMSVVIPVDEELARRAARLRTATGRASEISATDAIVAARAAASSGSTVITSDPDDLGALAAQCVARFSVVQA